MDADELQEIIVQYRSLNDAARQGMIRALDRAGQGRVEYGGIIFKDPDTGKFYLATHDGKAMEPVKGEVDAVDLRGFKTKANDVLAGSYHTHPPHDEAGLLSGNDVGVAEGSRAPVFMGQAFNRQARMFDPNVDRHRRKGRGANAGFMDDPGRPFMPSMTMVREDPSVLRGQTDEITALLRNP
jgi:hypothetical protein